ncbi:MAG: hypothetical protein ACRDGG_09625 [Anaerolineae bacterium]
MKFDLVQRIVSLVICCGLALVPIGLSSYWLIDFAVHARIDAGLYGQTPDGRPLPGHPIHSPHQHSSSIGISSSTSSLMAGSSANFSDAILLPAQPPSLDGERVEYDASAASIALSPPDPPPRA